jgi:L-threonylcarbamoyladenylate synthase
MASFLKIRHAVQAIRAGGVVAYPTEAVYGFGCDPLDHAAVGKILSLKRRPEHAGLILIAADADQLDGWVTPDTDLDQMTQPNTVVTWVVDAGPTTPEWISGGRDTVAVRITRHPLAAALCLAADMPIVSTSANRSGCQPATSALQVRCAFGTTIDYVLAGSTGQRLQPSEIRDARTGAILRTG